MSLSRVISAVLALALALPCAMPCYAWAVESGEVANENSVSGELQSDGVLHVSNGDSADADSAAAGGDSGSPDNDTAEEVTVGDGQYISDSDSLVRDFDILRAEETGETANASLGTDTENINGEVASSNIYFTYSLENLAQVIEGFYQLAEQRALTDEENEELALALSAWDYLGYGSGATTYGFFGKLPFIGSVLDATNEDVALSILYSIFGVPSDGEWGHYPNKWWENNTNVYMQNGVLGYLYDLSVHLANVNNKLSNVSSLLGNVYDRLGSVYDRLVVLSSDIWDTHRAVLDQFYEVEGKLDSINGALYGTDDAGNRQSLWQLLYSSQHGIRAVLESMANTNGYLDTISKSMGAAVDSLASIGKALETSNKIAEAINTRLASLQNGFPGWFDSISDRLDVANKILEAINTKNATSNTILEAINTKALGIKNVLEQLIDTKLQKLLDKDFTANLSADLSPVTQRLDEISRLLSLQGKSSMLDSFLGDFTLPVSSALSAKVQSALQNAFPFCIPAIMKQVLGLLDVQPAAAQVDYEIMGATVSLDFSAGGFAAQIALVTSWLCRILFVAMLLACSRNFIFAMPSKGG